MKSLALLDAIMEPEWEYRYYSFNSKWDQGEEMASMRNGQGDAWFCVFSSVGVFLKGFDHESPMSPWNMKTDRVWEGVLDCIPESFRPFAMEPAFSMADTTFCIWCCNEAEAWQTGHFQYPDGEDPDGSGWMLSILSGDPQDYKSWAESYYERSINIEAVRLIYEHKPLTDELLHRLNPDRDLDSLAADVKEIGYPA